MKDLSHLISNCGKWRDIQPSIWWPILWIRALHLPIQSAYTHTAVNTHTPWTHTRSSEQPFMLWRWGAVGGPVPCSRAPRYGIEGGERTFHSLPPPTIPAEPETRTRNPDYESDSLTIRPRLPQYSRYDKYSRYTVCINSVYRNKPCCARTVAAV